MGVMKSRTKTVAEKSTFNVRKALKFHKVSNKIIILLENVKRFSSKGHVKL